MAPAPAQPEAIPAERAHSETLVEMPTTQYAEAPMGVPGMMPPGMPGYGQPLGYPPQYAPMPQYAYPGYQMPGYYPQPMGYPPQMGQPMGMYPGMPQPMMAPQAAAPQPATATISAVDIDAGPQINLPDPETTGAKPPEPKPVQTDATGKPVSMRDTAADIINKYRTRPPA
jgi:hypothetical protein